MDITPYLGTIVTVIIAVGGFYIAIASRLTRLETKIEMLSDNVEKHNHIVERTYKAETEIENLYHRYDEINEKIKEAR